VAQECAADWASLFLVYGVTVFWKTTIPKAMARGPPAIFPVRNDSGPGVMRTRPGRKPRPRFTGLVA